MGFYYTAYFPLQYFETQSPLPTIILRTRDTLPSCIQPPDCKPHTLFSFSVCHMSSCLDTAIFQQFKIKWSANPYIQLTLKYQLGRQNKLRICIPGLYHELTREQHSKIEGELSKNTLKCRMCCFDAHREQIELKDAAVQINITYVNRCSVGQYITVEGAGKGSYTMVRKMGPQRTHS